MIQALRRAAGLDRPKIIAIIAMEYAEIEPALAFVRDTQAPLPVRIWCAADGVDTAAVMRDLRDFWPALCVVAWTGRQRGSIALKTLPLLRAPFRIIVLNENNGLFQLRPAPVVRHICWRTRDWALALFETAGAISFSVAYRSGQRLRDWGLLLWNAVSLHAPQFLWNKLLETAAKCAGVLAPFTLSAMHASREGRPHPEVLPQPANDRYVEIEIPHRAWNARRVLTALQQSDASFAVLHTSPADPAERDGLIALALRENAFAVARQEAYTGWRERVVTRHPFRALQAGEVSAVPAPHSSLVVMRRDALLRFGVPRTFTTGAAFLMLYWRAAAAGFLTLARGTGKPVGQEPAMPLEDAEFVLRLRRSKQLSGLAPAEPSTRRGNVASSPWMTRAAGVKTRVLVISPYLPFPLAHGGAVRIYNLCRSLADEVDFTLVCFREVHETICYEQLHEVFRAVHVVDIDEKRSDHSVPKQVAEYRNSAMAALIYRLCASGEIDIAQIEYTQMAEYREYTGKVPVILVEHDITFTLHRQIAEKDGGIEAAREYRLWLDFERAALQCSNAVWTMSAADRAAALEYGAPRMSTVVVPNGVDLERFVEKPRESGGDPTILFVGSFRHLPNLLAYEELVERIMPLVWRELPGARLHAIAGPLHERAANVAGRAGLLTPDRRIQLEGFISDVREAYRDCDVVAIPLPISAGTNIKVMEAMACARAAVSTPVGCQGLDVTDGRELLIRDNPEAFAGALIELLRNQELRQKIGIQARRTVEQRFGWQTIALTALDSYESLHTRRAAYA